MRAMVSGRVSAPVRVLIAVLALAGSLLLPGSESSADARVQMSHTPPSIGWEWAPLRLTAVVTCLGCDGIQVIAHYAFEDVQEQVSTTTLGGVGKVVTLDIPAYAVQRTQFRYWLEAIGKPRLCDELGCYGFDRSPAAGTHPVPVARVNLSADPQIFSPYGDDLRETTAFSLSTTNGQSVPWTVQVKNDVGTTLRQWTGNGASASITWDGKDSLGATVQEGIYSVHALNTSTGLPIAPKYNVQAASNQCDVLPPLSAWTQDIERTINCNLQSTINSLEAKYGGTVPGATRTAASVLTTGVLEMTLVNQDATGIDTTVGLAPGAAWVRTESGATPTQDVTYTQFMPSYQASGDGGIGDGDAVPSGSGGMVRMHPISWHNDGDQSASAGYKVSVWPWKPDNEKQFDPEAFHRAFSVKYKVRAYDGKKYWWLALHASGSANAHAEDTEYEGDKINIPSTSGATVNYSVSGPGIGVSWSQTLPGPSAHTDGDWDGRYNKHYNYWWTDTNDTSSTEKRLYMQNWWSCPRSEGACKVYVFYDSYRD